MKCFFVLSRFRDESLFDFVLNAFGLRMINYSRIIWFLPFLLIVSCSGHKIVKESSGDKRMIDKQDEISSSSPFVLGVGDEIAVNVWRNDDLKRTVQIDPSGNIYLPLAGEIQACGLTISQLRGKIASGLSKYIIDPQVDINVSGLKRSTSSARFNPLGLFLWTRECWPGKRYPKQEGLLTMPTRKRCSW